MKLNKLIALAALAASSAAMADTAAAPLDVTATVLKSCELSTSAVAFGSFKPASAGTVDAAGSVDVTCTKTTPYAVDMNTGNNSVTFAARNMKGGVGNADALSYNLYADAARTQLWGDSTESTVNMSGVGTGSEVSIPVFGRLARNQFITPDDYVDSVQVTVTY